MPCARCGATITPGAKFCPACGSPALQTSPAALPGYEPPNAALSSSSPLPHAGTLPKVTNGLAVASLVLGIVWVMWITSVLALIFGYVALGQIRDSGGTQGGRGLAIAGIVLGWVGVGFLLLFIVAAVLGS
jgi:hypothetical protein